MMKNSSSFRALAAVALMSLAAGCDPKPAAPPAGGAKPPVTGGAEAPHSHGAGPHEGTIADWGGGKYHIEFTVDHTKQEATVYILGSDEKSPSPIKATELLLSIVEPKLQTKLSAVPQAGDPTGTSSRFVGKHEGLGVVREYTGTITAEVDGTPYSGDFKEEPHAAH